VCVYCYCVINVIATTILTVTGGKMFVGEGRGGKYRAAEI